MPARLIAVLLALASFNLCAASLSNESTGYDWIKASGSERVSYVEGAMRRIGATYPTLEMMMCIQTVFDEPVKPHVHGQKISTVIALCHTQIGRG